jgi:membrane-bound lytic murein transglycosylase D
LALREAERALFPQNPGGFQPGFDWDHLDPSAQAAGLPPLSSAVPSATLPEAADLEWLRSLSLPDFRVQWTDQVVKYLKFYRDTAQGRGIARAWAAKSGRYTRAMRGELARAGLPRDLVWLSLIESGHNPTIVSPAGAAGIWQFIPASGRAYGLTVDRWVDERLDPQRATEAATKYLSDLYQRFGSWDLAMGGYNMGHGGMSRAIRKYNTNDFSRLVAYEAGLPLETALYVPKIYAVAIVMNNRRAFGIEDVQPDPAISFDTIYVDPGVSLADVAKVAGVPLESLRSMNPQYLLGSGPPSEEQKAGEAERWPVRVPRGLGRKATQLLAPTAKGVQLSSYVVRFGDTLESVARRRKTTVTELIALNRMAEGDLPMPGTVLLAPRLPTGEVLATDEEEAVAVPPRTVHVSGRRRVFYRVLAGDTLEAISNAFKVTSAELVSWNDLEVTARVPEGLSLQVFVPHSQDLTQVRYVLPINTRILQVGSAEFIEHHEAQNGRSRLVVIAKPGDTLRNIGQRYNLSSGTMERINRVHRDKKFAGGERVVVYAKRGTSAPADKPNPLAKIDAPHPEALP